MKKWLSILLIVAFLIGFVAPLAQPAYAATEETTYEEVAPSKSEETIPGEEIFEVDPIPDPQSIHRDIPTRTLDANGIPAVTSTPQVKWIDRLDNPPAYVRELYDWLAENSDGDGVDDALIDPTTLDLAYNQYYAHTVVELKELKVTYSHSGSDLKSAGSAAVKADKAKQKEAFVGYLVAAYAAFSRDYAGIFWFGGTGYYLTIPQSETYEDQGGGKGVATYGLTFAVVLLEPGDFDVRKEGYRDPAVIYETIRERDSLVKNITAQATGTRYEKIRFLNTWLTAHNGYNTTELNADLSNISYDCRNCMNALRGRAGTSGPICEGYTRAMKMLCDSLEIPCVLVDGKTNSGDHIWNYVQMEDGNWYAVDVTWNDPLVMTDNPITGSENENYLLIGKNTYAGGRLFSDSHIVKNEVYPTYTKFLNGPVLSATKYEPYQEPTVTGIAIMTPPAKMVYGLGEVLDTEGLTLTVYYSDGTIGFADRGYTVSGFNSATTGEKTVTVTYQGQTATFTITVNTVVVSSISILSRPDKIEYWIGEELDTTGLMLWINYSDDSMDFVTTGFTVSGFDSKTAGKKTVTVIYQGQTDTFTVTVKARELTIVNQPQSVVAKVGDTVTFTIVAEGVMTYKWQYKNPNATSWNNTSLTGYNTNTLTVANISTGHHGRQYRCIVTAADGSSLTSEPATLTVPYLKKEPQTAFGVPVNTDHQFKVEYSITEGVTYQWQYKGNTSSSTWANTGLTGNKTPNLTVKALSTRNGYSYRCVIKYNGQEITTKAAILYVASEAAVVTRKPEPATAVCGDYATFTIEAQGEGALYHWQWYHEGTDTWVSTYIAGYHTPELKVKTNNFNGGRLYRCRIRTVNGSGWNETYTEPAMLTVLPAAEVTQQPQNVTVKAGETAQFSIVAEGEGLTYQWQWAKFVGSWMNTSAPGATTDTLTITNVTKAMDGRYYRVIITNQYGGFVETKYVRLYVK